MDYWIWMFGFLRIVHGIPITPYTIHPDLVDFETALNSCPHGSFLTNMVRQEEPDEILSVLSERAVSTGEFSYWIGLRKSNRDCVVENLQLRGFKWTVDNTTDTAVSAWRKPPTSTCTGTRCGLLSGYYDGTTVVHWGLADSSCKLKYPFICKHLEGETKEKTTCPVPRIPSADPKPETAGRLQTLAVRCFSGEMFTLVCSPKTQVWTLSDGSDVDPTSLCLACQQGYVKDPFGNCVDVKDCSSGVCEKVAATTSPNVGNKMASFSRATPTRVKVISENPSPPTSPAQPTSPMDDVELLGTGDDHRYIFIPVLIAVMALVVLLVLVLAVVKCCLRRRVKKMAVKKLENPQEPVDHKGTDSMELANEKDTT